MTTDACGNRYRAWTELGIAPMTVEYMGGNPVAFVLSENLERRQMSKSQRAMVRALAQDWAKAATAGVNQHMRSDHVDQTTTRSDRAKDAGVHEVTQRRADAVVKASPELAKKVAHG